MEIDAELARFSEPPRRAILEDIVQQRVKELMQTRIYREERYLVTVRAVEGDHAQMEAAIPGRNTAQSAPHIPYQRDAVRDDDIDYAGLESGDHRLPMGRPPHASGAKSGLEPNAAAR